MMMLIFRAGAVLAVLYMMRLSGAPSWAFFLGALVIVLGRGMDPRR